MIINNYDSFLYTDKHNHDSICTRSKYNYGIYLYMVNHIYGSYLCTLNIYKLYNDGQLTFIIKVSQQYLEML